MMLRALRACIVGRSALKLEISFRSGPRRNYNSLSRGVALRPVSRKFDNSARFGRLKIHTTRRLDIPPALALLIRPLINVGAFLFGRYFKRWWATQTPAQKEIYKKWLVSKKGLFLGILGAFFTSLGAYYVWHLETDPLTQRRRFIILNKKQQASLAKLTYEMHLEEHKNNLIPHHHPAYTRIAAVTQKLLSANKDLPFVTEETWTLNVVNSDVKNAYVLPGGHIFVFMGTLNMVENDDQLAVILSHEMAHVLLKHPFEQISNAVILDIVLAIPLTILWSIFPDLVAFFAQALAKSILTIILRLPYSRALEREADDVGLSLAAKACVDPREAVVFWAMMKALVEMDLENAELPWLSTHPENEERQNFLDARIPEALDLRIQSGCLGVPRIDPRKRFQERSAKEQEASFKARGFLLNANR